VRISRKPPKSKSGKKSKRKGRASSSDESDSSDESKYSKVKKTLEPAFVGSGKKRTSFRGSHTGFNKIAKRIMPALLNSEDIAEGELVGVENPIPAVAEVLAEEVIHSCVQFLEDKTLETASGHLEVLKNYIGSLTVKEQRIGNFFFVGHMHQLFSHHLHLKEAVLKIMEENYGMLLKSLMKSDITSHPHFAGLDSDLIEHMESIGSIMDSLLKAPTFFLVDMVSIQVFSTIYYLGQKAGISGTSGSYKEDFLGVHETAIVEVRSRILVIIPFEKLTGLFSACASFYALRVLSQSLHDPHGRSPSCRWQQLPEPDVF
jgi:hypothetical protein